jgi:hypothetical protein
MRSLVEISSCNLLIGILIFLTYEFKIVLALAGYNYFEEFFGENHNHFIKGVTAIAVKCPFRIF